MDIPLKDQKCVLEDADTQGYSNHWKIKFFSSLPPFYNDFFFFFFGLSVNEVYMPDTTLGYSDTLVDTQEKNPAIILKAVNTG